MCLFEEVEINLDFYSLICCFEEEKDVQQILFWLKNIYRNLILVDISKNVKT